MVVVVVVMIVDIIFIDLLVENLAQYGCSCTCNVNQVHRLLFVNYLRPAWLMRH